MRIKSPYVGGITGGKCNYIVCKVLTTYLYGSTLCSVWGEGKLGQDVVLCVQRRKSQTMSGTFGKIQNSVVFVH